MTKTNSSAKPTKRDNFALLLSLSEVQAHSNLVAFIEHEIELLDKKNASKKPTENQVANADFKAEILKIAKENPNQMFTITDFLKKLGDPVLTNQRVSAIVRQMYDSKDTGEIFPLIRFEEKRKAYFKLNPDYVIED